MSDLWIEHCSAHTWLEPGVWTTYFEHVQELLRSPITRLDERDPVRRKIESLEEAGRYVCEFKPAEQSRWLFGKMGKAKFDFCIQHYREVDGFSNTVTWYVPMSYLDEAENRQRVRALFDLGNRTFRPYFSWSDDFDQVKGKKTDSGGAINPQRELLGVLWLTYFNPAYVSYFGDRKFESIPGVERAADQSITITLGERPSLVPDGLRQQAANVLGEYAFAGPYPDPLGKRQGQYVLTYEELRAAQQSKGALIKESPHHE